LWQGSAGILVAARLPARDAGSRQGRPRAKALYDKRGGYPSPEVDRRKGARCAACSALLDAGLVNKVTFFIAPMIVGGVNAPAAVAGIGADRIKNAIQLEDVEVVAHGRDIEITGYPAKQG